MGPVYIGRFGDDIIHHVRYVAMLDHAGVERGQFILSGETIVEEEKKRLLKGRVLRQFLDRNAVIVQMTVQAIHVTLGRFPGDHALHTLGEFDFAWFGNQLDSHGNLLVHSVDLGQAPAGAWWSGWEELSHKRVCLLILWHNYNYGTNGSQLGLSGVKIWSNSVDPASAAQQAAPGNARHSRVSLSVSIFGPRISTTVISRSLYRKRSPASGIRPS